MRRITKAALTLAAAASTATALAAVAAGPAAAKTYPPPAIHLQCTATGSTTPRAHQRASARPRNAAS